MAAYTQFGYGYPSASQVCKKSFVSYLIAYNFPIELNLYHIG